MQYILSKEELDNLVPKKEKEQRDKALNYARKRILKAAKFDCVHDHKGTMYCDDCPVLSNQKEIEDYEGRIGNRYDLFDLDRLICTLPKRNSK